MRHLVLAAALLWAPVEALAQTPDAGRDQAKCDLAANPPLIDKTTMTHPPYPKTSVRLNQQGTVILNVTINPEGMATDDSLAKSSGAARLDNAALDWVKQHWRWKRTDSCSGTVTTVVSMVFAFGVDPNLPPFDPSFYRR